MSRRELHFHQDFMKLTFPHAFTDEQVFHWKRRIEDFLEKNESYVNKHIGTHVRVCKIEQNPTGMGHCYYLQNTEKNIHLFHKLVQTHLPGCELHHELSTIQSSFSTSGGSFQSSRAYITWIEIPYTIGHSKVKKWMGTRRSELTRLLIYLFILFLLIFLLSKHWEGYHQPWKRLYFWNEST